MRPRCEPRRPIARESARVSARVTSFEPGHAYHGDDIAIAVFWRHDCSTPKTKEQLKERQEIAEEM